MLIIVNAAPIGSNIAVYAQRLGLDSSYAVQMVCLSTLLSLITLLVMGAVFVLLAIPFLLFYDRTVLPLCNRCLPRQECTCMPTATALL